MADSYDHTLNWSNEEDADVTMNSEADSSPVEVAQFPDSAWQPTADEVPAAAAFDQANAVAQDDITTEQILQQALDHEMALQFDAMENGAAHAIGLSWTDQDVPPETFECACGDTFTHAQLRNGDALMITCMNSHVRCKDCLNENVRIGLSSRANYPPKCCGPFDIVDIFEYLEEDVRAAWFDKREEYEDIAPVYCAVKECSQYLTKEKLFGDGKWALCDKCCIKTCTGCLCLESAHEEGSAECPERISKMDKELMVKAGWKPCPRCAHMIERSDGCDHMECHCGQHFCYTCGRLLDGAIPCNCSGQREWVEEDEDATDAEAQQRILDDILAGRNGIEGDENNDEDRDGDEGIDDEEEDDEDIDEEEENDDEEDEDDDDDHEEDQNSITNAIRALHRTEPQLAIRMDLLSRVQVRPYTLPGFAADLRRVRDMTGETFNKEMDDLSDAMLGLRDMSEQGNTGQPQGMDTGTDW